MKKEKQINLPEEILRFIFKFIRLFYPGAILIFITDGFVEDISMPKDESILLIMVMILMLVGVDRLEKLILS